LLPSYKPYSCTLHNIPQSLRTCEPTRGSSTACCTLQHTATYSLQHTATHCNTL